MQGWEWPWWERETSLLGLREKGDWGGAVRMKTASDCVR